MREIKFRAWDKEEKEIKDVTVLDFADWWVGTGYKEGERNSFRNEETDRHILMQYTGLKDKNGKEIYEGDLIEFNNCDYQRTAGHLDDEIVVGKVEYSCGRWGLIEANGQSHDLYISLVNDDEAEIIGNIYENPELLEEAT